MGFIKSTDHRHTDHRPTDHRPFYSPTHPPTDPPTKQSPTQPTRFYFKDLINKKNHITENKNSWKNVNLYVGLPSI